MSASPNGSVATLPGSTCRSRMRAGSAITNGEPLRRIGLLISSYPLAVRHGMDPTSMTSPGQERFNVSALIGDALVEQHAPPAEELLTMLTRGDIWGDVSIHPAAADFPRAILSFHAPQGFVFQCYEDTGL